MHHRSSQAIRKNACELFRIIAQTNV